MCSYSAHPCQECGRAKSNPAHSKKKGSCKFKGRLGCTKCGKFKNHPDHKGAPPSLNDFGSGNRQMFINLKKEWEELFTFHLEMAKVPLGMESVSVTAKVIFPDNTKVRDEGNIRFMIEKALGDALVSGGWIPDDCFYPVRRYTFGQLEAEHRPGINGVVLTIWPEG